MGCLWDVWAAWRARGNPIAKAAWGSRSSQNWDLCGKWGPLIRAEQAVPWGSGYTVMMVPSTLTSPSACSGWCLE